MLGLMPVLTNGMYDALVSEWNGDGKKVSRLARLDRAAECKAKGHDWAVTPLGADTLVCRRCLRYDVRD